MKKENWLAGLGLLGACALCCALPLLGGLTVLGVSSFAYLGGYCAYVRDSRDRYLSKAGITPIVLPNNRMQLQFLQSERSLEDMNIEENGPEHNISARFFNRPILSKNVIIIVFLISLF
ncbi:hypothetical protein D3C73_929050 [compost metagenome]